MQIRKHNQSRICIYPRVCGLPLGIFIITVVVVVFSTIGAMAFKSLGIGIFILIFLIAMYTLNIIFAGNFGWSKKRMRHEYVKTGLFMSTIDSDLKRLRHAKENKTVV